MPYNKCVNKNAPYVTPVTQTLNTWTKKMLHSRIILLAIFLLSPISNLAAEEANLNLTEGAQPSNAPDLLRRRVI